MSIKDITIVITSFKSGEIIRNCLNSIDRQCQTIIIENSNDQVFKEKRLPNKVPTASTWGEGPQWICRVLTDFSLTASTSEARRMIQQGAVYVDGEKISDYNLELQGNRGYLLKVGKKKFLKIIEK